MRKQPSPARRSFRPASSRRCAGASRRTIPPFPSRTGPSPISPATARAASTRSSAGSPGTADLRPSCSTATRRPKANAFFDLGGADHSPDHRLMAWGADIKGSEYFTIRVRDLENGTDLPDEVPQTSGGAVWLNDSSGFYYVELDENHRPVRVKRHLLGTEHRPGPGDLRGAGSRLLRQARRHAIRRLRAHRGERPRDLRNLAARPRRRIRAAPRLVEPRTPQLNTMSSITATA